VLTFQLIIKSYRPIFSKIFLLLKVGTKFYIEQDPDPNFSRGRIRFFSKIVSGSGLKSSGSGPKSFGFATLVKNEINQSNLLFLFQVLGLLEELVGQNKVLETYVMPFSGEYRHSF
jgi:hypothetical protein